MGKKVQRGVKAASGPVAYLLSLVEKRTGENILSPHIVTNSTSPALPTSSADGNDEKAMIF
jgi:hypothetical protein